MSISTIQDFYDQNVEPEWERLEIRHRTEYAVTLRALKEFLPPVPAKIIDIGGGPGRYSIALAGQGYDVSLVDLSAGNLAFSQQKASEAGVKLAGIIQANALDLSAFAAESFDAALLVGPLYHLHTETERYQALCEAKRLLKPGGLVFAAVITRFAPFRDAAKKGQEWVAKDPIYTEHLLNTGVHNNGDGFTDAYFAHPDEVTPLGQAAGFETVIRLGCEGVVAGHEQYINSLQGDDFNYWADLNYRLGKDPALAGASDHILYIGRKA